MILMPLSLSDLILSANLELFPKVNRSERAWKFLVAADKAFIKLFCFKPNRLGPGSVFIRLKKEVPVRTISSQRDKHR